MRSTVVTGILILCLIFGSTMTVFGANGRMVVVVDRNYPPYSYGTVKKAEGLYTRLIEGVFGRMGMKVEVRALPWKQALREGGEGRAAVGGIYKNTARLKIYDYSEPLFEERLAVYVKKGRTFHFSRLADLQGKIIGLNSDWSYGDKFDSARKKYHFTAEEAASNLENFRKLVAGKIDCLVADQVAASRIIRQENLSDKVQKLDKPAAVNDVYLAFAKRLGEKNLLERFNRTLEAMKKDGSYRRLFRDFIAGSPER